MINFDEKNVTFSSTVDHIFTIKIFPKSQVSKDADVRHHICIQPKRVKHFDFCRKQKKTAGFMTGVKTAK